MTPEEKRIRIVELEQGLENIKDKVPKDQYEEYKHEVERKIALLNY